MPKLDHSPLEEFLNLRPSIDAWHSQYELQAQAKDKSDESDEDDDDEDDDEEDDDDEDDDDDADKTVEELRAELKTVRASLKGANGSSQRRRELLKKTKAKLAEAEARASGKPSKSGKPKGDDDDEKPDVDAITRDAKAAGRAEALNLVKTSAVSAALAAAGVPAARLDKAAKLVDFDDLDVDDNGKVDGLEEALDELKTDWPELFGRPTRKRRSVAGDADKDGKGTGTKKLTATERQARQLLGK